MPLRNWQRDLDLGIENDLTHAGAVPSSVSSLRCYDCKAVITSGDRCASCAKTFAPAPLRAFDHPEPRSHVA
jgi:hypothetical protein